MLIGLDKHSAGIALEPSSALIAPERVICDAIKIDANRNQLFQQNNELIRKLPDLV